MQDSRLAPIIALLSFAMLVTACAPYRLSDRRAAICNQLNSQMIFAGSTGNSRQQDIQNAEAPMVARTYERDNCNPS
jgi:hypothetical protein